MAGRQSKKPIPFIYQWRSALASEFGPTSPITRHVLLTLAIHMDEHGGSCFPSTRTLEEETALSRTCVMAHLGYATNAKWIKTSKRDKSAGQAWAGNQYCANIPQSFFEKSGACGASDNKKGGQQGTPPLHTEGGQRGAPPKVVALEQKVVNVTWQGGQPDVVKVVNVVDPSISLVLQEYSGQPPVDKSTMKVKSATQDQPPKPEPQSQPPKPLAGNIGQHMNLQRLRECWEQAQKGQK